MQLLRLHTLKLALARSGQGVLRGVELCPRKELLVLESKSHVHVHPYWHPMLGHPFYKPA